MLLCSTLLTVGFLGQSTLRVNALQLALQTVSGATIPSTHAHDGLLGRPGRTASQITLSSHTNCSAGQAAAFGYRLLMTTVHCI